LVQGYLNKICFTQASTVSAEKLLFSGYPQALGWIPASCLNSLQLPGLGLGSSLLLNIDIEDKKKAPQLRGFFFIQKIEN
jgi:hypothetical protein